ncbi:zinc dependent phospholipase C family protein [uncultured Eubacterium sp.]|uniref:zinc dependent phospholipase C family protein n=1 Tax=uncultured Eubacterium sp. TaxID=165185 RepID=UPI0015BACBB0|nr:zinc dependent phospholipase C family protein [uncultured Eubacterium sp.]
MPAYSSHFLFANIMLNDIRQAVDFELDEPAVYIGTQGPDIFYDHRALPWMYGKSLRAVGSALHRSVPSALLDALRDYVEQNQNNDIAKSYAVGFILHYSLDRICHPYVYAMQKQITDKHPRVHHFTAHNTVEFALDSYLINRMLDINKPTGFKTFEAFDFTDEVADECARAIAYVVNSCTDFRISSFQARQAVDDLMYIQKVTYDPRHIKRMILHPLETALSPVTKGFMPSTMMLIDDLTLCKRLANESHSAWHSPYNSTERTESFYDLFTLAAPDSMGIIKAFFNGDNLKNKTNNLSFLTGERVE